MAERRQSMRTAGPKQPREAVPFARALDRFLAANNLSAQLGGWRVLAAWKDAVGPDLAAHARAVRFARGELLVEVDSAAHFHELANFTGEQYREIANERLGSARIRLVHFQLKR